MTIQQFCDVQGGIQDSGRAALIHQHNGKDRTYEEWYPIVAKEVSLKDSPKKAFPKDKKSGKASDSAE